MLWVGGWPNLPPQSVSICRTRNKTHNLINFSVNAMGLADAAVTQLLTKYLSQRGDANITLTALTQGYSADAFCASKCRREKFF